MIVIVDSNILFSACITAEKQNKLSGIFFRKFSGLDRISCHYAIEELFHHREKLIKASGLTENKLGLLLSETLKQVAFYNEATIEPRYWQEADKLTRNVDSKDIAFVALTIQTGGLLWTGDKKLTEHLKKMGFDRVINTAELAALLHM